MNLFCTKNECHTNIKSAILEFSMNCKISVGKFALAIYMQYTKIIIYNIKGKTPEIGGQR